MEIGRKIYYDQQGEIVHYTPMLSGDVLEPPEYEGEYEGIIQLAYGEREDEILNKFHWYVNLNNGQLVIVQKPVSEPSTEPTLEDKINYLYYKSIGVIA